MSHLNNGGNARWSDRDSSDIREVSSNFWAVSIDDRQPFAKVPYGIYTSKTSIVD